MMKLSLFCVSLLSVRTTGSVLILFPQASADVWLSTPVAKYVTSHIPFFSDDPSHAAFVETSCREIENCITSLTGRLIRIV